ncbi:MAG: starch-binding protein, partial [Paludibacteraceae bacterium]|nr:starch-binding protein [Paludibacteraceae bacterium]
QSAVQTHEYETEHNGEPITVRFRKPADWEAVYLWAWDNNGNLFPGGASAKWPGAAITDEGNGWWSHTFDATIYEVNIVFNDGKASGGKQTSDLYTDKSVCYALSDMGIAVETDCNATGLRDTHIESIAVYPNPAHHTLHVQGVDNVKAMDVYSATGQKMTSVHNSAMLNVSGWSKGIYFLIIKTDNTVHNARFIKE